MNSGDWYNLLLDVISAVVSSLLNASLKKSVNKRSQIKSMRKKNSKNTSIKLQVSSLNMEIKYKGIGVKIILPISQQLISFVIDILC